VNILIESVENVAVIAADHYRTIVVLSLKMFFDGFSHF